MFFFVKSQDAPRGRLHQRAVRQVALNGEAGRTYSFSALSSNSSGSRPFMPWDAGATPVKATIFLKEAPVLDPRPGNALPSRIPVKPAGGPSPAGASLCAFVA